MKVTILCVGKIKESFYREAIAEYSKRISAFSKLEIVEVPESRLPKEPSAAEIFAGIHAEGLNLLSKIPQKAFAVGLFIEGRTYSSVELAELIEKEQQNTGDFVFIIGGSNGLSRAVAERCATKLSFSKMTFPHQLMRVILCEQLYRAFGIINGNQYHK